MQHGLTWPDHEGERGERHCDGERWLRQQTDHSIDLSGRALTLPHATQRRKDEPAVMSSARPQQQQANLGIARMLEWQSLS